MKTNTNTQKWLKGLLSAALGGAGTGITLMLIDPSHYNIFDRGNMAKFAGAVAIGALLSVGNYLKKSPLDTKEVLCDPPSTLN